MHSSVYTLGARCMFSGGCQCNSGGNWNRGESELCAAWLEANQAARLWDSDDYTRRSDRCMARTSDKTIMLYCNW